MQHGQPVQLVPRRKVRIASVHVDVIIIETSKIKKKAHSDIEW